MARKNYGKDWEEHFKNDFIGTFPGQFIYRLKDDVSMRKGSGRNPCDFLAHVDNTLYMLEVKCTYENTFNFSYLRQYNDLTTYLGLKNVEIGVIIWYISNDKVLYVPIETIIKMKKDGEKSINIRKLKDYKVIQVPATKLRVFMKCDYSFMREEIVK